MMVLTFFIVLNFIALFLFIKYKKRMLHVLEILVYWLVSTIIFLNYTAILYSNTNYLIIPDRHSAGVAHLINRSVLVPIIMVTFLNIYLILSTIGKRLLLIIGFLIVLVGYEWLTDYLGVLEHFHWRVWWSFAFWFIALLLCIWFMLIFRKILYKRR